MIPLPGRGVAILAQPSRYRHRTFGRSVDSAALPRRVGIERAGVTIVRWSNIGRERAGRRRDAYNDHAGAGHDDDTDVGWVDRRAAGRVIASGGAREMRTTV